MIGPSGPMQSPDGIDAIIPINLAAIVFNDVNDVSFCVTGDLPPLGDVVVDVPGDCNKLPLR